MKNSLGFENKKLKNEVKIDEEYGVAIKQKQKGIKHSQHTN